MSDFNFTFSEKNNADAIHEAKQPRYPEPISSKVLMDIFDGCSDFQYRNISPGLISNDNLFICWLDGLCDGSAISKEVIKPLTAVIRCGTSPEPQRLMEGVVYSSTAMLRDETDKVIDDITHGCCAVIFNNVAQAVCFELRSSKQRSISEPTLEKSIKGAKDSFVELLRTNTALVRQRLCNPSLKLKSSVVGRKTKTRVGIFYIDGVADPETVSQLESRLDKIDIDGLLSSSSIEQYIVDNPRSIFPQLIHTERPDRFARQLLNGRVGLLVDGLPIGFLLPVNLAEFLRVPQDDAQHAAVSTALSLVRSLAFVLALSLPAFYVAIAMYHQEMIPTKLLMSIIASKQDVPFSSALEVLGMLVAFELLQEAGLRMPNPVGDTVSIIGALVVGQSAVEAKVISPIAVIVVAFSAISGLAQPSQDLSAALRLCRFALVLAAIAAGLFGVTALLCLIILHLCTIESFGRSYTAPLSSGQKGSMGKTLFRRMAPKDKYRDTELRTPDRRRQS